VLATACAIFVSHIEPAARHARAVAVYRLAPKTSPPVEI
jgi:hypothetical protein